MLTRTPSGDVEVHVERAAAMLALTAIHDIMKVEPLCSHQSPKPHHSSENSSVSSEAISIIRSHQYHPKPSASSEAISIIRSHQYHPTPSASSEAICIIRSHQYHPNPSSVARTLASPPMYRPRAQVEALLPCVAKDNA
eukprot:2467196-Prymnesium_polylepis.1